MTISLSPSTANFLQPSMLDNQATKSLGDNKAFNHQLQKEISSLREPIEKTGKITSGIDAETEQDAPITTTVDISPELAQQNFLALIMNARPPLLPLDIPQTNSDTAASQPSSTVKPVISNALNGITDQPIKAMSIATVPLSADQYTKIKPASIALSTTESESTVTPIIAKTNTLKATIDQPAVKATTIVPAPLFTDHQYTAPVTLIPTESESAATSAIANTLKATIDQPVKATTTTLAPLFTDRQYTAPVTLSPTESESAATSAIANTLKATIEQPIKATITTPAPLFTDRQYTEIKPTQALLISVTPEIPTDISQPETPVNIQSMQSAQGNMAITYPPSNTISSVTYDISPSFNSPNWDKAINQQVVWMVQNKLQTASLTINPPHLGPVQVMMQIDNQQATVQFVSAQPEIREALQNALPLLADMLKQSGIQLGHADVSSQHKNPDPKPLPNQSKTNKNSVDTSVTEPVINTQHTNNAGQGLINLIV
jgi:flagellar hook-length control protein FliK